MPILRNKARETKNKVTCVATNPIGAGVLSISHGPFLSFFPYQHNGRSLEYERFVERTYLDFVFQEEHEERKN